jgi:hypothetical protein
MSRIVVLAGEDVALYRADAPRTPLVLLVLPAIFLSFFDYACPFGSPSDPSSWSLPGSNSCREGSL